MIVISKRHASLVLFLLGSACQGDTLSVGGGEPLQPEDVEDVSPGDAVGESFGGAYLFTGFDTRTCQCRSGSEVAVCGDAELAGDGLWLIQDDGALEVRLFTAEEVQDHLVLRGGVDADGAVRFGGVNTVTDGGQPVGQTVNDVVGALEPGGRGELRWAYRVEAVLGTESIDCDVVIDLSLGWWDPAAIESCGLASDCHPSLPVCVGDRCATGEPGNACSLGSDCVSGACRAGVCAGEGDCEAVGCPSEQICFEGSCQSGVEGDACETALHCAVGMKCTEATCYDGSEGDPCDSPVDCAPQAQRCFLGQCQDGSQGDPCQSNFDCEGLDGLACDPSGVCG